MIGLSFCNRVPRRYGVGARCATLAATLAAGLTGTTATAVAQPRAAATAPGAAAPAPVPSRYLVKLTPENSALIMVDYLTGFWPGLRTVDSVTYENNVTALAKIGQIFRLPTVILGDTGSFRGQFYPQMARYLPGAQRVERHSPSAWKEAAFRDALARTGRRKVIIAGISVDNCVLLTSLDLLRAGYEVYVVVDASGTDSRLVEDAALMRLAQAGAVMTSWVSLASELMDDWQHPTGPAVGALYQQHSGWGEGPGRRPEAGSPRARRGRSREQP
jgi:nicotinamidase-related amidase